ncbi:MAG: hypothetical protein JRF56_09500 [Deltaproteobacteria bacterium]|nr:hypothetical protein [Deltaproteobacteria bacterium]
MEMDMQEPSQMCRFYGAGHDPAAMPGKLSGTGGMLTRVNHIIISYWGIAGCA